jgi:hypothetical protein
MRSIMFGLPFAVLASFAMLHCGDNGGESSNSPGGAAPGKNDAGAGTDGASLGGDDGAASGDDGGSMDAWTAPEVGTIAEAGNPGQVDITFEIYATENVRAISPYIYGLNDISQAAPTHATIVRSGGNRLTAFNWENNASNAGSDYQFENDDLLCSNNFCGGSSDTPGAFVKTIVDKATAAGAAALITVPIVDYVAADKSPGGDVRSSGANYLQTRFKKNVAAKGAAFAYPPDTSDAFVYEDEMVSWLTKMAPPSTTLRFQLDNEPDLWSATHAEVHPMPVSYQELAKRNVDFALAIKAVAPGAHVVGPVNYGWEGFVNLQNAPDASKDGDFLDWWLDQMKIAEMTAGKRVVDELDVHWYPEAQGGGKRIVDTGTGADEVAAREQAPRSLWDTTYTETSWITQSSTMGPLSLIPRLQQKIAQHYPGTSLSITEWNYGAGEDISGAIASADVLGIFGAYGVDMAMMWPMSKETFTNAAFKAYRNYDGNGAAFGDTSVKATTTDVVNGTVYASLQSSDSARLVVIAISKATVDKAAGIVIHHGTTYSKADVYTLTAAGGANLVQGSALTPVATNAFRYTMPAQSVSVIVPVP